MLGQSLLLRASYDTDELSVLADPDAILHRGRAGHRLRACINEILREEQAYGIWKTQTRTDAGAWLYYPYVWLVCTDEGIHSLAEGPSLLGGKVVHRFFAWSALSGLRYNDITAQVIVEVQVHSETWPAFSIDPVDGYALAALCERFLHDS